LKSRLLAPPPSLHFYQSIFPGPPFKHFPLSTSLLTMPPLEPVKRMPKQPQRALPALVNPTRSSVKRPVGRPKKSFSNQVDKKRAASTRKKAALRQDENEE